MVYLVSLSGEGKPGRPLLAVKRVDVLNACGLYESKTPHMPTNVGLPSVAACCIQVRVRHQSQISNSMAAYLRTSRGIVVILNNNISSNEKDNTINADH